MDRSYGVRCCFGWCIFADPLPAAIVFPAVPLRKSGTKEEAEALHQEMSKLHPHVKYVVEPYRGL